MKNNNTEKDNDEPMFGNEHLPQITIQVSQTCIERQNKPKELILAGEGIGYAYALFHLLMMVTDQEIHRDTDIKHAIQTIGYLGQRFAAIAQIALSDYEMELDSEVKK